MLVALINFLQAWRRYNTSLRELYQLGDRELADIGMRRGDIRYVFDEAFVAGAERARSTRPLVAANSNEDRTAAAA